MKTVEVMELINHLTTDKDEQQELWLYYLENSDLSALSSRLSQIRNMYSEEELLQITVWKQLENPSDFNLQWIFDHFTDLEQSVIQLLILGVTLQQISSIKNLGINKLRHIINVIREQPCWGELDVIED